MSEQWNAATVSQVADALREDLGSWMLGELGRGGLVDAIWDHHLPFQRMSREDAELFTDAVYREIFG